MNEAERFWVKVDAGDCWEWTAAKGAGGYGVFHVTGRKVTGRTMVKAHRWAYEYLVGPIADGLTVDHLCRVRHCVNPDHMELVDMRTNMRRGYSPPAQHARRTHCPEGHPMVQIQGQRTCRTCRNRYLREHRERERRAAGVPIGGFKTHCIKGHPFDEVNTYVRPSGIRGCRECTREANRKAKRRAREGRQAGNAVKAT